MRARLHRIFPGVGAALALLTFASPLLGTFHEATVRHVACPEHGELVDAPDEAPHPHARTSSSSPALFAERDPAGPSATGEEHTHCAVVLAARVRARGQSQSLSMDPSPGAAPAPRPHREVPGLLGLAVYRLAPKASPPLA